MPDNTIQQEQQEQNYLLTYDRRDKRVKAVTGVGPDHELQTVDPTSQNKQKFMRVDQHGNPLTNFRDNFLAQFNRPTDHALYKITDTEAPEAAVERISAIRSTEDPQLRKQLSEGRIYNNNRFNECEVDFKELEKHGITREKLDANDNLKRMLMGKRSKDAFEINGENARLSFFRNDDGKVVNDAHFIQPKYDYKQPFYGHTFTDKQTANLESDTGHAGELIDLKLNGQIRPCYLSRDTVTNEIKILPADELRLPNKINGKEIPADQFQKLKAGGETHPVQFTSSTGTEYSTSLQVSAIDRGVEMLFDRGIHAGVRRSIKKKIDDMAKGLANKLNSREDGKMRQPKVNTPKNINKKPGPKM